MDTGKEGTMWTKGQVGTGSHSSPCPLAADQPFKSPKVKGQKPAGNVWESLSGRSPEGSWRDQEKEAPTCNHRNQSEVSGETGRHSGEPGNRTQTGQSRRWHAPASKDHVIRKSQDSLGRHSLTETKGKWGGQRGRNSQVTTYCAGLFNKGKAN